MIIPSLLLKLFPYLSLGLGMFFAAGDSGLADAGGGAPEVPITDDVSLDGEEEAPLSDFEILNSEDDDAGKSEQQKAEEAQAAAEAAESLKTSEQKEAEKKAAETAAAAKAAESAKNLTPEQKFDQEQAEIENRPVKAIHKYLSKVPELKAVLDKHPKFLQKVFADARRSAKLLQFTPHFATPEIAAQARQDLEVFDRIERPWYSDDPKAPEELLNQLLELDYVRDDKGQPVVENGIPKTGGRYERLMRSYRELGLYPVLLGYAKEAAALTPEQQVEYLGQELDLDDFSNFVEMVKRLVGDVKPGKAAAGKGNGSAIDESKLPEETRKLLERGRAADAQQRSGETTEAQKQNAAIKAAIRSGCEAVLRKSVDVYAVALPEGTREKITGEAFAHISAMAKKDRGYQRQLDALQVAYRNKPDELQFRLVAAAKNYVHALKVDVVREKSAQYTTGAVAANKEKLAAKDEKKNSNLEVRTQGADEVPAARGVREQMTEANALVRKLYNRNLTEIEIAQLDEELITELKGRLRQRGLK